MAPAATTRAIVHAESAERRGRPGAADRAYRRAVLLARRLRPSRAASRQLARALIALGEFLQRHGRYREAMTLARPFKSDSVMRAVHFLSAIELPDGLPEARESAAELSSETPAHLDALLSAVALNLMLGETNQAAGIAQGYLAGQGMMARLAMPSPALRLIRYLAGEMDEEDLLGSVARGREQIMFHHFVGLQHLARGHQHARFLRARDRRIAEKQRQQHEGGDPQRDDRATWDLACQNFLARHRSRHRRHAAKRMGAAHKHQAREVGHLVGQTFLSAGPTYSSDQIDYGVPRSMADKNVCPTDRRTSPTCVRGSACARR